MFYISRSCTHVGTQKIQCKPNVLAFVSHGLIIGMWKVKGIPEQANRKEKSKNTKRKLANF